MYLILSAEHEQNPSLRYINIGISTVMAYEGILENELVQFRHAIDLVGDALQYVDFEELEGKLLWIFDVFRFIRSRMTSLQLLNWRQTVFVYFIFVYFILAQAMTARKRDRIVDAMTRLLSKAWNRPLDG